MKRSAGVTAAAVVLLAGSALLVLLVIGSILVAAFLPSSMNPQVSHPGALSQTTLMTVAAVLYLILAGWGIATAIGILRLRPWARISLLVMSSLALVGCLGAGTILALLPTTPVVQDARTLLTVRIVAVGMLGVPGVIAAWWLILFTRRSVNLQFAGETGATGPAGAPLDVLPVRTGQRRPVSITVIAVFLLAGAGSLALMVPMYHFTSSIGFPALILGVMVTGYGAVLFYLAFGLLELALGLGLWWMKPWARVGTIAFCVFSLANAGAVALRPEAILQTAAAINAAGGIPASFEMTAAFFRVIFAFSIVPVLTALWFLVRSKSAFAPSSAAG